MKVALLMAVLMTGCQDYNSNTGDRAKYGNSDLEASTEFRTAYGIVQNRCTNCHSSSIHNTWATYTTSQKWIESGRVIAGDAQNSSLVKRIWNSGHTDSNMPQGQGPLPNDEYQAIVDWINNLP